MRKGKTCFVIAGILLAGCASSATNTDAAGSDGGVADAEPSDALATDGGGAPDSAAGDAIAVPPNVRGLRYCEILLVNVLGAQVHIDVYNTFGLNDCPDEVWSKVDAAKVATETGASQAIINGPRYWLMSAFENGALLDATPRTLGGLPMRLAGAIDLPLASVSSLGKMPYTGTTIQRRTTVRFDAGKSVYELVGPDAKVDAMQSYSTQKVAQTEADLSTLGARLSLPAGWTYRERMLGEALRITALNDQATIIQDDVGNSYQLTNP